MIISSLKNLTNQVMIISSLKNLTNQVSTAMRYFKI